MKKPLFIARGVIHISEKPRNKLTLDDIAKELGLSKASVSRVISGKGRISDQTRARVMEHIKKRGYQPNLIARSLAQQKTMNIAVVLPADGSIVEMPFFQNLLIGICNIASKSNYDVIVLTQEENDISQIDRVVRHKKVDGVILTRSMARNIDAEYLEENEVPFVMIGSATDKTIQIDHDHVSACRDLTSSVLSGYDRDALRGRVALIGGEMQYIVNQSRHTGFLEGIRLVGLSEEDYTFFRMDSKEMIRDAIREIIKREQKVIFCFDDLICENALLELGRHGIRVPGDIEVASYYCSYIIEKHYPRIAAIKFDAKMLGETAFNILDGMLSGQEVPQKTLLEYKLVNTR